MKGAEQISLDRKNEWSSLPKEYEMRNCPYMSLHNIKSNSEMSSIV